MTETWRIAHFSLIEQHVSDERFLSYARIVASHRPSLILLSGGDHDAAHHSFAFWNPHRTFTAKGNRCSLIEEGSSPRVVRADPFEILNHLFTSSFPAYDLSLRPLMGGAVGYVAYEVKNVIERLPQTARDDLGLPDLFLFFPQEMLIHHRPSGTLHYLVVTPRGRVSHNVPTPSTDSPINPHAMRGDVTGWHSNFSRETYLRAVEQVRHYIRDGHVYQVNLSQRYSFQLSGDLFSLWTSLYRRNPAPFYAFFRGNGHTILSTSMERFLLAEGQTIETRPIKGTRPRGSTPKEDEMLKVDLLSHPKDDAELSMIVDLLRNDLGKICVPGSVHVVEHKRLERYHNVQHLISIVKGELREHLSYGEILRATFPGGSITGCPKIRAMEIIDELEPQVRHVYTGSIGYLGFHRTMDLNIAIRTMIAKEITPPPPPHSQETRLYQGAIAVGGGIVYESDPETEYEETLHKGQTFFEILRSFATQGDSSP